MSNGGGPPKGSAWDSPFASPGTPYANGAPGVSVPSDPAHPPPRDPLTPESVQATRTILRQIPNITIQHDWRIDQVRHALRAHNEGVFEASGQLVDSILGDDRVQATLGSRNSGLFGQPVRFKRADHPDKAAAKKCLKAWRKAWPRFATSAALTQMNHYEIMMGFSPAQLLWDTSGDVWIPQIEPWHPRYTYYDWSRFAFMAISNDGTSQITPGDGKWLFRSRMGYGVNARPWLWGGIRPTASPFIFRHWAIRDLARYTEVHGMPIRKGVVPASSDEVQRDRFGQQLSMLGQETSLLVQKGVDGAGQDFDLELVEAKDTSWEAMIGLRDHCDMAITLALLFQNLTTEVKGGSFAATSAHMDIRSSGIQSDNEGWRLDIYNQIARPFAYFNYGDADLAPWTDWAVRPLSDWDQIAGMLYKFGLSVEVLRRGGVQFKSSDDLRAFARSMGVKLPAIKFVDPVAVAVAGEASKASKAKADTPNAALVSEIARYKAQIQERDARIARLQKQAA